MEKDRNKREERTWRGVRERERERRRKRRRRKAKRKLEVSGALFVRHAGFEVPDREPSRQQNNYLGFELSRVY